MIAVGWNPPIAPAAPGAGSMVLPQGAHPQTSWNLAAYPTVGVAPAQNGVPQLTQAGKAIPLVSLGCSCGPKMAFDEMGRGSETLPLDWMCTTLEGVIGFLTTEFQGFYQFNSIEAATMPEGTNIKVFRGVNHSWWHDDPTNPATQEKYNRRISRLFSMKSVNEPILFVRVAATTDELPMVDTLARKLVEKFGPRAMLLIVIGGQLPNNVGPCIVSSIPNLMVYYMHGGGGMNMYCPAIAAGLEWAAGKSPSNCQRLPDLRTAQSRATASHAGLFGMGGVPAFENIAPHIRAPPRTAVTTSLEASGATQDPLLQSRAAVTIPSQASVATQDPLLRSRAAVAIPFQAAGATQDPLLKSRAHSYLPTATSNVDTNIRASPGMHTPSPAWPQTEQSSASLSGAQQALKRNSIQAGPMRNMFFCGQAAHLKGAGAPRSLSAGPRASYSPPPTFASAPRGSLSPPRKYSSAAAPVRFPFKAGPSPPPGPEEDNTESIPPLEPILQAIQPPQRVPPQRVLQPIQPPQKPSVGVPPKLEEKGANAYEVGARVEVWSKGAQAWCPATVDHLEGPMVFVKYRIPTGATMMKGIPYFHSTIRHASIA